MRTFFWSVTAAAIFIIWGLFMADPVPASPATEAQEICSAVAENPTPEGVWGEVMRMLNVDRMSEDDAVAAMTVAMEYECSEYKPVLLRLADMLNAGQYPEWTPPAFGTGGSVNAGPRIGGVLGA